MFAKFAGIHTNKVTIMLRYLKTYRLSLLFVLLVVYLSFFRPPSTGLSRIPHFDKVVHFGMYFIMSMLLWWEFLKSHKSPKPYWHAWLGAAVCPVLFSGAVELLQNCTSYRGGDWLDFAANSTGVVAACLISYFWLRRRYCD